MNKGLQLRAIFYSCGGAPRFLCVLLLAFAAASSVSVRNWKVSASKHLDLLTMYVVHTKMGVEHDHFAKKRGIRYENSNSEYIACATHLDVILMCRTSKYFVHSTPSI